MTGANVDGSASGVEAEPTEGLLLDVMLGKLSTYLRMCGYDATYALDRGVEGDDDLLALAVTEGRTLVTRDESLAARAAAGLRIESTDVHEQLRELRAAGYDLSLSDRPRYCGACNAPLERVSWAESTPEYAPDPGAERVWRCRDCGQHFWRGSHWRDVAETLETL
ncbi:Mut7-C RNAse domain-containing protein [Haloarculaceae archaeon H-GB1-1]|nr:Mut7-C RNAse domain-containing protein [Haloarculaceae archaeon H-GB1-1]